MVKTVFVVGAGTGYDFDMPLGADLVREIADLLKYRSDVPPSQRQGPFWSSLRIWLEGEGRGFSQDVLDALDRLARSIHFAKSIDTLINDAGDPLIRDIGKIAISHVISKAEGDVPFLFGTEYLLIVTKDYVPNSKAPKIEIDTFEEVSLGGSSNGKKERKNSFSNTWFTSFFRELRAGLSQQEFRERLSNTTIINFNYDRLLEYFLLVAIRQYDGVTFEEAGLWLKDLTHVHPYGVLAPPPEFQGDRQVAGIPVGTLSEGDVAKAPQMIKTFDEGVEDRSRSQISEAMHDASNVVLLGYGYHRQNNDLLKFDDMDGIRLWGSAFGISEEKRQFIARQIEQDAIHDFRINKVRLENLDCRELIDQFGDDFFIFSDID